MKRNYTADLIKFFAAVLIMTCHFPSTYAYITPNAPMVTVLFFMVSGVFMMRSLEKYSGENIGRETVKFIRGKLKGFWAYYVVAFFIAFVLYQIGSRNGIKDAAFSFTQGIWELLLIQYAGFNESIFFVGGTWYLSVMMLAFVILVPLALKFKDTYRCIIAPFISIFIYGYLYSEYGSLLTVNWVAVEHIYNPLLLGIAGISLGNCVYSLSKGLKEITFNKVGRITLHSVEFILFALFFLHCGVFPGPIADGRDYFYLFACALGLVLTFGLNGNSLLENKFVAFLGRLSLPMYLANDSARSLLLKILPETMTNKPRLPLFLGLCAVNTCLIWLGGNMIKRNYPKLREKLKNLLTE